MINTTNTPFQKRYIFSPSVFARFHPTEVQGSQAHFQLSMLPKSKNRDIPLSISRHYFVNGSVVVPENGMFNLFSDLHDTVYVRINFQTKNRSVLQMVIIDRSIVIGRFNYRIAMFLCKLFQ